LSTNKNIDCNESIVETRYLVMPHHTNHLGSLFGGQLLSWIDMTGAMSAQKHSKNEVVTVSMDSISFRNPINIGDHVVIKARVGYVGNTSMEVEIIVIKENPLNNTNIEATKAYMTFVAIDHNKKPVLVPKLNLITPEDHNRFKNGMLRAEFRKKLDKAVHQS